jgi:hypothetical protein
VLTAGELAYAERLEASITMKLKRGAVAATFFLAALTALGIHGIKLDDI